MKHPLLFFLVCAACSGSHPAQQSSVDDTDTPATAGASGTDDPLPDATAGSPGVAPAEPEVPVDCTSEQAPPSPLRRLTQREYQNTVRDLLGVELAIGDFPADPVGGGFDNNAAALAISPLHAEKYLEAAEALAQQALDTNWEALVPCTEAATLEEAAALDCARDFVESLGRRAYRRPLSEPDVEQLLSAFDVGREGAGFREGITLVLQAILQAPAFLYRFEVGAGSPSDNGFVELNDYELASRLSYFLLGSMPSDELLGAAAAGELSDPERSQEWARALLDDERAVEQLAEFHRQWLGVRALERLQKDLDAFPELDDTLREALAAELPAFVARVWSDDRRLASLLRAPLAFGSDPLAELYGAEPAQRTGLLMQPAVLAVHALPDQTSPVARGKLVREKLLCQTPPAPPPNANITPPKVDPSQSTRERFAAHTSSPSCKGCHELMDPIGFAFESYDALGRYRQSEGDIAIDTSGWISGSRDADGEFADARELAERLADSEQVHDCVVTQWFRFAFGRFEAPADACSIAEAQQAFTSADGDIKELLVALTQTEAFRHRRAIETDEP